MKKSIITALFLGSFACAQAQLTTLYSEDFEGDDQVIFSQGWNFIKLHPDSSDGGIFQPSPSIQAKGFTGKTIGGLTFTTVGTTITNLPNTDVLIRSRNYDIPVVGTTSVSFRRGSVPAGASASSHYAVYIMAMEEFVGLDTPAALKTYLDAKTRATSATISGQSSIVTLDLSAYAGKTVALLFRLYNSPTNSILLMDDVTVSNTPLSTADFVASQFSVYPNPASNKVKVAASNGKGITKITITDLNGRIVKTKDLAGIESTDIDLNDMASGTYLMGISSEEGTIMKKIVKI